MPTGFSFENRRISKKAKVELAGWLEAENNRWYDHSGNRPKRKPRKKPKPVVLEPLAKYADIKAYEDERAKSGRAKVPMKLAYAETARVLRALRWKKMYDSGMGYHEIAEKEGVNPVFVRTEIGEVAGDE